MSSFTRDDSGNVVRNTQFDPADTVREEWGLECPSCHSDENLEIEVRCYMRLTPNGTSEDGAEHGDHEWDDESRACCTNCDWMGLVADAKVPE